jgi:Short C-terminal domain
LNILVPLLYAVAIFLARGRRRRTLISVGFAWVFAGVLVLLGRSIMESQVTSSLVKDASLRPAVTAVVSIATTMLSTIAGAVVIIGIVLVAAAGFAGRARIAVAARRAIAPFLRDQAGGTFGVVATVMVLIFIWQPIHATGTPAGIIVFSLLALFGTEVLRRGTAKEFPDAQAGATTAALRARARDLREGRRRAGAPTAGTASLTEQLERLAALRHDGSITAEEYDAAKANLLPAQR